MAAAVVLTARRGVFGLFDFDKIETVDINSHTYTLSRSTHTHTRIDAHKTIVCSRAIVRGHPITLSYSLIR